LPLPTATTPVPVADDTATTPTAAAIAGGRALMERVRTAGGGPALTALRSFELIGTSTMTGLRVSRSLKVTALFPQFYRQEESTPDTLPGRPFHTTMGLEGDRGWLTGAIIRGDGRAADREAVLRLYTRAARQAMAGFLAGINAPWLLDTGKYTFTDRGSLTAGTDRGALVVALDGPDGPVGRLLIDPGTLLPRRLIQPQQADGGGQVAVAETVFTYSDYQPQAGLQLPHTIVRENGTNRTVWSITQYKVNPRLTPRAFARDRR
jgi:hypothetical protein